MERIRVAWFARGGGTYATGSDWYVSVERRPLDGAHFRTREAAERYVREMVEKDMPTRVPDVFREALD